MTLCLRAALAAALLGCLPAGAQDFSKVEIATTKLGDTTYMMTGAGGNLGLSIGEDAVFLIDDQYAPLTERIRAAIAKLTPKPVRFVINTHWHGDHTGGNEKMGRGGAIIVAHENVRKRLSEKQFIAFLKMDAPPLAREGLPVVTFASAIAFHLNGDEMRVIHVPHAHTDGDAIVHFVKSDVVHMGDVYFNGLYPFIDADTGGSIDGVVAACDLVLGFVSDTTRIIPGHGALSGKAELKAYRDMLSTVAGRIRNLLAQGKSVEEVVAAGVSADYDARWGKGFMSPAKFVGSVASSLAGK